MIYLQNASTPIPPQLFILPQISNTGPNKRLGSHKVLELDGIPPLDSGVSSSPKQASQVRTAEPFAVLGQFPEILTELNGQVANNCLQNVHTLCWAWQVHEEEGLETTWTEHGWIDDIRPVGCCDYVDALTAAAQAVEFGKECVHDTRRGLGDCIITTRDKSIQFIKEDNAGNRRASADEDLPYGPFGLSDKFVK